MRFMAFRLPAVPPVPTDSARNAPFDRYVRTCVSRSRIYADRVSLQSGFRDKAYLIEKMIHAEG